MNTLSKTHRTNSLFKLNNIKALLSICLFFLVHNSKAQLASYNFTQGMEVYTAITGGTILWSGAGIDDDIPVNIAIPSFNYNGTNYTSCYVSPNGYISFGSAPSSTEYRPISSATATYTGAISAFGWDLISASAGSPEVRYQQVNDEFIIQWQDFKRNTISTIERFSFQIKLNANTNEVKIVYGGPIVATNNTTYPQVGLRGASNSSYRNRKVVATTGYWFNSTEGTANNDNCYFNSTTSSTTPLSGLTFTWSAPCFNASLPYSINFDNIAASTLPPCTAVLDLNAAANTWNVEPAPTDSACFNGNVLAYHYDSFEDADEWFFSKGVSLTAGTTYTLQYVYGASSSDFPESIEIKYGTSTTAVAMTNSIASHSSIDQRFYQGEVNFVPSSSGTFYLGFHANSIADMYDLYLDDILLTTYTPCLKPTNVNVYNISTTSAVLSFTNNGSATQWEVEYGVAPYVFTGTATATFTTNPYTISGLTPGTKYQIKVRSNCGASKSLWTRMNEFTTVCNASTNLPFVESFNGPALPSCWSVSPEIATGDWRIKNSLDGVPSPKNGSGFIGKSYIDSDALLYSAPFNLNGFAGLPVQVNVWIYRNSNNDVTDRVAFYVNNSKSLTGAHQLLEIFPNTAIAPVVASNGWYNYKVSMPTSYNTSGIIYIMAQGTTSSGGNSDALGIDEFRLELASGLDIQANSFVTPSAVGCYGSSETVSVVVENMGNTPINFATNNLTLNVNITGALTTTLTTTVNSGSLAVGALATYTVGNVNLSVAGNYFFNGNAVLTGESPTANNSFATAIREKIPTYTLPYSETFNSLPHLSDPSTWNEASGNWFVADALGMTSTKAYLTQVNPSNPQAKTITKFNAGAVTNLTSLTLDYRIVNTHALASSPTAATTLTANDFVTVKYSTDCGVNYTLLHTITNLNHTPTLNYRNLVFSLSSLVGQNVQIEIEANAYALGSNDFYFSMDNFNITQPLDNNSSLSNLVSSQGTLSPTFVSTTTSYTVTLPMGTVGSATLTPTLVSSYSSVTSNVSATNVAGTYPSNTAVIVVTAQTGNSTTYTVTYNVIPGNSNSSLSNLTTSAGTLSPSFNSSTYNYTVTLPIGSSGSATLTPTLSTTLSTITSNTSASDVNGTAPANVASVVITAQNGSTSTYTVTYTVATLNTNSSLSDLISNVGTLFPAFTSGTYNYSVTLPFGSSGSATLTPTLSTTLSTITSNTAASDVSGTSPSNVASVVVTAQNGATSTYTVTYNISSVNTNSSLSNLTTSIGTLSPVFSSGTFNYTVTLPFGTSGTASLTPTLATTLSTITSNVSASNVAAANGTANVATVIVTAQSGASSTYTVTYNVTSGNSTSSLSNLTTSVGALSPVFASGTYSYTVTLPVGSTGSATLTPTLTTTLSTITSNVSASNVAGSSPNNIASVIITAQDGSSSTYTVVYNVSSASNNALLASLTTSSGTLSPVFNASTYTYNVILPQGSTGSTTVTAIAASASSTVAITQATDVAGAAPANTATVIVTAQDGITALTYTITYSVETGVNDMEQFNLTVDVFPNPVVNELSLKLSNTNSSPINIKIVNELGQLVLEKKIVDKNHNSIYCFDLSILPKGNYIVIVNDQKATKIKKIAKN